MDHGRDLRLDDLRQEMKQTHQRPIKTLQEIESGVAAFENSMCEFTQAGGTAPSDHEMTMDLLRLLLERTQLDLMWNASEDTMQFA